MIKNLFIILFFAISSILAQDLPAPEGPTSDEDRTVVFGSLDISQEDLRKVAENIYHVSKAMSEEYEVGDGMTLTMYILRYMAEIGSYEIVNKDLMILVTAFEKLMKEKVSPEVHHVLAQIRKIKFGKKRGKFYSKFYAFNTDEGIVIPINEVETDPSSSVKEIKKVVGKDGFELHFHDVQTDEDKKVLRDFIKIPVKVLGVFNSFAKSLNQINKSIKDNLDDYLEQKEFPAPPMIVDMEDIKVEVDTTTIFDQIDFKFTQAVVLPGIKSEDGAVPSFVLGAKAKLLKLKISVDQ